MKIFLDCEFTKLNRDSKLISLALVSESGREFYVELIDTYLVEDCSDFVIQNVLPQLDPLRCGQSLSESQASLCSGQLIPDTVLSFSSALAGASPLLN